MTKGSFIVLIAVVVSALLGLFIPTGAVASPVALDYVPAYDWYHGCGPTAAASILGYWDVHGYDGLFDVSGWDEVRYTQNVRDHISSPEHNAKYDSTPDNSGLSEPPDTSIADFFHTSEGGLGYGWSYQAYADDGLAGYASYRGYEFDAWYVSSGGISWETFMAEIDAGYPVMTLVDTNADGLTDHFVPAIGYDDRGDEGFWYGLYTTWSENEDILWQEFALMTAGVSWGIGYMTFFHPISEPTHRGLPVSFIGGENPPSNSAVSPVPEPATILLLGSGLLGLVGFRRKSKVFSNFSDSAN
jgi:hypothetical protein